MVRAILAGQKTQTRRLFKLPTWLAKRGADLSRAFADKAYGVTPCLKVPYDEDELVERVRNPWGFPEPGGVRLWVKETWAIRDAGARVSTDAFTWPDGFPLERLQYIATDEVPHGNHWWNKRSALFMPRWASRITLEVTDVRCERLQDISEDDARAEGCQDGANDPRELFECLWDSINGKRAPWASNPWIWCLSFRRLP
jgi:hypothetical protein